jgi:hypothetical protein
MYIQFSLNGIDPIATYAAVLSTFIAVWEWLKWRSKHEIQLTCTPNMLFISAPDENKYIVAKVTNKGETQTTITHFLGYYWPSKWHRLFKRRKESFIIHALNVPVIVQPGEQWMGQAIQNAEIEKKATEGILYIGVIHSMGKKEVMRRVKIEKNV